MQRQRVRRYCAENCGGTQFQFIDDVAVLSFGGSAAGKAGAVPGSCRYARRCATTGAGAQPAQAALEFHSCGAQAVGPAAWGREEGGVQLLSDRGVGAHHIGDELNWSW